MLTEVERTFTIVGGPEFPGGNKIAQVTNMKASLSTCNSACEVNLEIRDQTDLETSFECVVILFSVS